MTAMLTFIRDLLIADPTLTGLVGTNIEYAADPAVGTFPKIAYKLSGVQPAEYMPMNTQTANLVVTYLDSIDNIPNCFTAAERIAAVLKNQKGSAAGEAVYLLKFSGAVIDYYSESLYMGEVTFILHGEVL